MTTPEPSSPVKSTTMSDTVVASVRASELSSLKSGVDFHRVSSGLSVAGGSSDVHFSFS
jgi:hypothetical protein